MGRHHSNRDGNRSEKRRKRKRRTSSSSSSSNGSANRRNDERLAELRVLVQQLDRRFESCTRGSGARLGDEQMIPIFDPTKDEIMVEKWIQHVDDLAVQYNWEDRSIMRLIASRLRGHARQWYDTRQPITTTWMETKELLRQQFSKPVPFSKLFKEAALYEARAGQSLADYCFQKLNKLRKLDVAIPEKYLIDIVIGGIANENIARIVRASQHADVNALYAYMMTLGNMPTSDELTRPSTSREITEMQNDKRPSISCHNCGKDGNLAKD